MAQENQKFKFKVKIYREEVLTSTALWRKERLLVKYFTEVASYVQVTTGARHGGGGDRWQQGTQCNVAWINKAYNIYSINLQ